jgi:hypothetical protein
MLQSRAVGAYARGKPENAVLPAAFARRLGVRKSKKNAAGLPRRLIEGSIITWKRTS